MIKKVMHQTRGTGRQLVSYTMDMADTDNDQREDQWECSEGTSYNFPVQMTKINPAVLMILETFPLLVGFLSSRMLHLKSKTKDPQ